MARHVTAVVTGSNRGIGAGIVQLLAKTKHTAGPLIIYATSRAGQTKGFDASTSTKHGNEVRYEKLDISNQPSIKAFVNKVTEAGETVDILINNAGINLNKNETYSDAQQTIDVNYRAVRDMCQIFLNEGKMKNNSNARIVNVSSTGSSLRIHDSKLQESFRSTRTVEDVDALADEYLSLHQEGGLQNAGFGGGAISYQVSKACVNSLTRVLASENRDGGLLINCCCPGWVDTDMGNIVGRPSKSIEDGAKIPVKLAIGDIGSTTGEYWSNDGVSQTDDGKPQRW